GRAALHRAQVPGTRDKVRALRGAVARALALWAPALASDPPRRDPRLVRPAHPHGQGNAQRDTDVGGETRFPSSPLQPRALSLRAQPGWGAGARSAPPCMWAGTLPGNRRLQSLSATRARTPDRTRKRGR